MRSARRAAYSIAVIPGVTGHQSAEALSSQVTEKGPSHTFTWFQKMWVSLMHGLAKLQLLRSHGV
jgi:hypothetical protein